MNKKLPRRIGKIEKMIVRLLFFFPESEKSNHDNEPLGRTGVCACVLYQT